MKTIKEVLNQDHSKKTKAQLSEMMQTLQNLITQEEYQKISLVPPKNLPNSTKKEILDVVEDFQKKYKDAWEKFAANSPEILIRFAKEIMTKDEASFGVQNAADAGFAAELGSLDFENLIAGPLNACVTAQNKASLATVNFIQQVGLKDDGSGGKEVVMVKFKCEKPQVNPHFEKTAGEGGVPPDANTTDEYLDPKKIHVEVPLVSIINIPSLRIENCDIDFNVKLNSVYTKDVTSEFGIDASVSGGWGPVKFKVSASYKRSSSTGVRVEKEYNMGVKVRATNDQLPGALEQVLGILAE